MKNIHTTSTAAALAATGLLVLSPVAFADEAQLPSSAGVSQLATLAQASETTSTPMAGEEPTEDTHEATQPSDSDETPEPIEVVPVPTPSPSDDAEPTPAPSAPEEPSPEPTDLPETPEPIEVVPVPTPSEPAPSPSDDAAPTPAPNAPEEPSPEPSEAENTPMPVTSLTPSPTATSQAPSLAEAPSEEVGTVTVDEQQNIVLTGAVIEESTNATGENVLVTQEVTAAGEQVTTRYVANPASGQTTVTQTVTNPVTGEQKTTERTVPATTFKAGGAASITAAKVAEPGSNTLPVLLGITAAAGLTLATAGAVLYRRQK